MQRITQFGRTTCTIGLVALQFPGVVGDFVILGDIFLKEYYTVFDADGSRVGFADKASISFFPL